MIIVIPYHEADAAMATVLCNLIVDLEESVRPKDIAFLVCRRSDTKDHGLSAILRKKFVVLNEYVACFSERGWPQGCNAMFRECAKYVATLPLSDTVNGFYWMEPDCAPLRRDWYMELQAEWKNTGRLILGCELVPPHLKPHVNGSAIYSTQIIKTIPQLILSTEVAWDYEHREVMLKFCQPTNRIALCLKGKCATAKTLRDQPKEVVVIHGFKDFSLLKLVRRTVIEKNDKADWEQEHVGKTAWIVGYGESLAAHIPMDIEAGDAVIYCDGAVGGHVFTENEYCLQTDKDLTSALASVKAKHLIRHDLINYNPQAETINPADLGGGNNSPTALIAVGLARDMGCAKVVFVGFDIWFGIKKVSGSVIKSVSTEKLWLATGAAKEEILRVARRFAHVQVQINLPKAEK